MVRVQDDGDFVVIGDAPDRPGVAFARVADREAAGRQVRELGARRLPRGGESFDVYADPAGHPFCLVSW